VNIDQADIRREAIAKALKEHKESSNPRTLEIEFRTHKINIQVITVRPSLLLLNHNNGRLGAQLEDHPKRDLVVQNPTSHDAQVVLAELLRSTEKFKDLKHELDAFSQQFPGLISRDGLLINGNTRVVALTDLEADGVDVAVLPSDANSEDFLELEMSLQMTRWTHQDYTFTNELLQMNRYLQATRSIPKLATKMGWTRNGTKKVEQSLRFWAIIEEIRALSESHLPYSTFDSKKQHLKDLDEEYQKLKVNGEIQAAEKMKWARIAALFLGINKDQVRTIDSNFFEEDVMKRLETKSDALQILEESKKLVIPDDLDELLGSNNEPLEQLDMRKFVQGMLNSPEMRDQDGSVKKDFGDTYSPIAQGVRLAAEEIITEEKLDNYRAEPAEVLREIRLNLQRVLEKFPEVSAMSGFKIGDFDYELKKVSDIISRIVKISQKYNS
jgi:hypothetical protein